MQHLAKNKLIYYVFNEKFGVRDHLSSNCNYNLNNNKGNNMTKISKLLVGILFSALVMAPSYAGEMAVSGGVRNLRY